MSNDNNKLMIEPAKINKPGLFDSTSYEEDGVTPKSVEQPSALKLLIDDSTKELEEYDKESADLFKKSQSSLGPESTPSYEAALRADEEALNYYRDSVMPKMSELEKKAAEVKGKRAMGGVMDYLPLVAAAMTMNSNDASLFISSYMQAREGKFNNARELEIYDLENQAKALERTMKLHGMTSTLRHNAYQYGKEQLKYVGMKLEEKKKEFAVSKTPAIEQASYVLGRKLFESTLNGTPIDLSMNTVVGSIMNTAKAMKLPIDATNLSESQKKYLYNITISSITAKSNDYLDAHLKQVAKMQEAAAKEAGKEPDMTTRSEWLVPVKTTSDEARAYTEGSKELSKRMETTSEDMNWMQTKARISKEFNGLVSSIVDNSTINNDPSAITSKLVEIALLPVEKRSEEVVKLSKSLSPRVSFYVPKVILVQKQINKALSVLDSYGDNITARSSLSDVAKSISSVVLVANNHISSIFSKMQQATDENGNTQTVAKGMSNPVTLQIAFKMMADNAKVRKPYQQTAFDLAELFSIELQDHEEYKGLESAFASAQTNEAREVAFEKIKELAKKNKTGYSSLEKIMAESILIPAKDKKAELISREIFNAISAAYTAVSGLVWANKQVSLDSSVIPAMSIATDKDSTSYKSSLNKFIVNKALSSIRPQDRAYLEFILQLD